MTPDDFARFKAYDRLNAVSDVLIIAAVLFFTYYYPNPIFDQVGAYILALLMALFSLLWHSLVPDRYLGPRKLLAKNIADAVFATLLISYTGQEQSPFFFVYYVVLLAAGLSIGVRHTFVIAAAVSVGYAVVSGIAIQRLIMEPRSFIYIWANIASLWLVGYLAAFLADEAEKARRGVVEAKQQAETFSRVDWLTGLYNMNHLEVIGTQELARGQRYGHSVAILMLDSDHLKAVNDRYGHPFGDQLIRNLAEVLTRLARRTDTVIRYGGDEFIVLLPETDSVGARFLAERIRATVEEQPLDARGQNISATVSLGVASYPKDASDLMTLLARADAALRYSKQMGRNRVSSYALAMDGGLEAVAEGC